MENFEWHTEDIYTDYLLYYKDGCTYVLGDVTQIEGSIFEDENGIKTQHKFKAETPFGDIIEAERVVCSTFYKVPILWDKFKVEDNESNSDLFGTYSTRELAKNKLLEKAN